MNFRVFEEGYFQPCEITTYLGGKYYGLFVDAIDKKKSTFFIPFTKDLAENLRFQTWKDQEKSNCVTAILEKYGILIPDESFITSYKENVPQYNMVNASTGPRNANIRTNKLFIIGAGASHGFSFKKNTTSYEDPRFRIQMQPPLVDGIFDQSFAEIYSLYPGVTSCISNIRFKENVEEYFESEWQLLERSSAAPELLRNQINIQFYLRHLFYAITNSCNNHEHNLYDALISKFDHYVRTNTNERIAIISFNYDFLLEKAIEKRNKFDFKAIDDYISNDHKINIFKPHGSANWGWKIDQMNPIIFGVPNVAGSPTFSDLPNWLYYHKKGLDEVYEKMLNGYVIGYGKYLINTDQISIVNTINNSSNLTYPALFLPYQYKDEFMMPYKHQTLMDLCLQEVNEICVIGWKGAEMEFNKRLKTCLRDKKVKLTIVDPKSYYVKQNLSFIQTEGDPIFYKDFYSYCKEGTI